MIDALPRLITVGYYLKTFPRLIYIRRVFYLLYGSKFIFRKNSFPLTLLILMQHHYDYIIAGAGCAGLTLLRHMMQHANFSNKKILLRLS